MKKMLILSAVLVSGLTIAQEKKPVLEQEGSLVKATYYHENGQIQQQGFFKNGKLEGQWVSYDENGVKKSFGEYASGEKTGKWVFWNDKTLSEVDYSKSRISSIKSWKEAAIVNK